MYNTPLNTPLNTLYTYYTLNTTTPWCVHRYQSISKNHCTNASTGKYTCKGRHEEDDATNTHRSIRVKNATHNFLYAEFTDGSTDTDWAWPAVRVCVCERGGERRRGGFTLYVWLHDQRCVSVRM